MSIHDLLNRVPLLISYPTILLSSNLIVPSHREVLEKGQVGIIQNGHTFFDIDHIIRLILLPMFTASCFVSMGYLSHAIDLNIRASEGIPTRLDHRKVLLALFIISFLVSQVNFMQGSIQATVLSLLMIHECFRFAKNNFKITFSYVIHLLKVFGPLFLISIAIGYDPENYNFYISDIVSYTILFVIILFLSPYTGLNSNIKVRTRDSGAKVVNKRIFVTVPVVVFLLLLVISMLYDLYKIQFLMVVVFVGCSSIFFLTLEDIKTNESEHSHSEHNSNCYFIGVSLRNVMLITGLMSILLQYLSFSAIARGLMGNIFTVVFVIVAEVINMSLTSQEQTPSHNHKSGSTESENTNEKSILRQIASNEDTKSIFSFLLLNTTFMFVQLLYSFRSKSLGLLSDSLHMALDCTSLLLGLIAGVLSKKQPSCKFPFALKALGTLAGFTNGILLLGIVCGIFIEAVGRFFNPVHLHGTNELLVVAILGLLVNLVGLFAFDHAGHGHDEGSGHEENMKGIFLHILADTLGSVGVIVSTILIKMTSWPIFDPLASMFIGSLILLSSIPLLKSTVNGLLFKLDDRSHNVVKNALNQISMTPGITGYTTPRFWPNRTPSLAHSHAHSHANSHSDSQIHGHGHADDHDHHHDHDHNHEHKHHDIVTSDEDESSRCNLTGYIHIQYIDSENSTIIKKRVEKIFENNNIRAWIQVEPQNSECWCRKAK